MPGPYIRPVRIQQRSFQELLAERFNQLAEFNGECVALRWSALDGFKRISPNPATGENSEERVIEAQVLAEMARMSADEAGAFGLARAQSDVDADAVVGG